MHETSRTRCSEWQHDSRSRKLEKRVGLSKDQSMFTITSLLLNMVVAVVGVCTRVENRL
jgi:hypothetical protein